VRSVVSSGWRRHDMVSITSKQKNCILVLKMQPLKMFSARFLRQWTALITLILAACLLIPLVNNVMETSMSRHVPLPREPEDFKMTQEDPELIELIRQKYLDLAPPPFTAYNLSKVHSVQTMAGQFGQAEKVATLFEGKTQGFFIESGAADGEKFSNTLLFELNYNWTGLLVEANPLSYQKLLSKNRRVVSVGGCLSPAQHSQKVQFEVMATDTISAIHSEDGKGPADFWKNNDNINKERIKMVTVKCFPLYSILMAMGNPTVDFFSLDVEGSEQGVLESIPWDKVDIRVLTIEFSHIDRESVQRLLEKNGYEHLFKVGVDMVFRKRSSV
jgi:hypothetical protein